MKTNQYGEIIYNETDLCDLVMQGHDLNKFDNLIVDGDLLKTVALVLDDIPKFIQYNQLAQESVQEFDHRCQSTWYMPDQYQQLDIAEHVLSLCNTQEELQRCGQELLLFQERNLFDLLKYLKYLVDVMRDNNVIWGVGRGSSVSSYVLYLLGVHRINSMFYDLDPLEFLR